VPDLHSPAERYGKPEKLPMNAGVVSVLLCRCKVDDLPSTKQNLCNNVYENRVTSPLIIRGYEDKRQVDHPVIPNF
jgi:hypothetical protein